jgi:hypothetical protein
MALVECGSCDAAFTVEDGTEARVFLWLHAWHEHRDILAKDWPPVGATYWQHPPDRLLDKAPKIV